VRCHRSSVGGFSLPLILSRAHASSLSHAHSLFCARTLSLFRAPSLFFSPCSYSVSLESMHVVARERVVEFAFS